jgi:hypothetical protein
VDTGGHDVVLDPNAFHVLVTGSTLVDSAAVAKSGASHRETADN